MYRKLFFSTERFIKNNGITFLVTVATIAVAAVITIWAVFSDDVYVFIADRHIFEAVVLLALLELLLFTARKDSTSEEFQLFSVEGETQSKVIDLIDGKLIKQVSILSSGLGSRTSLVSSILRKTIPVDILVQSPETAVDNKDAAKLHENVEWIRFNAGEKSFSNLTVRLNPNVSTVRAIILYEAHTEVKHLFFGWYTYLNQAVSGSPNPTFYATNQNPRGRAVLEWIENIIAQDIAQSRLFNL